jgi:hypothetical protein
MLTSSLLRVNHYLYEFIFSTRMERDTYMMLIKFTNSSHSHNILYTFKETWDSSCYMIPHQQDNGEKRFTSQSARKRVSFSFSLSFISAHPTLRLLWEFLYRKVDFHCLCTTLFHYYGFLPFFIYIYNLQLWKNSVSCTKHPRFGVEGLCSSTFQSSFKVRKWSFILIIDSILWTQQSLIHIFIQKQLGSLVWFWYLIEVSLISDIP